MISRGSERALRAANWLLSLSCFGMTIALIRGNAPALSVSMDSARPFFELLSLSLTIPTVILAALVVGLFSPRVIDHLFDDRPMISTDWLILGIVIGFTGSFFDNLYWGLAWSASYLEAPAKDSLFRSGVYPNIPFRQLTGVLAGYCHLRGILSHKSRGAALVVALLCGLAYGLALLLLR